MLKYDTGEVELLRSFSALEKSKNFISVDSEKINNHQLLDYLNILWITPIMEKIMLQTNSEKRNFFDRLIFNINKKHLRNYTKLQKLLSERLHLLKNRNYDEDWLGIIEKKISNLSGQILIDRNNFIHLLNDTLKTSEVPLSFCEVQFEHKLQETKTDINIEEFKEKYETILTHNRLIDSKLNTTSQTVNKVSINIFNSDNKTIEAKHCSTGEQKSILLSIFLSVARMVKNKNNNRSPIILIDEAMAHLDSDHKDYLFYELSNLNSQVWFSGVSKDLFENINNQTVFFEMKNIV